MKIKSFRADGVHGYLKFDMNFSQNLNFVIGNNGAGKTSAIRLILGLLSPSWFNLTQIKYAYAEVDCETEEDKITVRAEAMEGDEIKLTLTINGVVESSRSGVIKGINIATRELANFTRFDKNQIVNRYARFEAHFLELDVVSEIRSLITPIFLGLDRRIHVGSEIDLISFDTFTRERDFTQSVKGNLHESLIDIENLVKNAFLEYSQRQTQISNELKNDIIFSSFNVIKDDAFNFQIDHNVDLESKRLKVLEASKNMDVTLLENNVNTYFSELTRIQQELIKQKGLAVKQKSDFNSKYINLLSQWFINSPQLQRIDSIIKFYEEAQSKVEKAFEKFLTFERIVNEFFKDSNKTIKVTNTGVIDIFVPITESTTIFELSSGEKQILVMIVQLIFGHKRQVFIIDEPELSLHLGWQEIFVESIVKASPNTQFIMATHSPTIVGSIENEKYCIDLNLIQDLC